MPESHRFCLSCGTDTTRSQHAKDPLIGKTLVGKYSVTDVLGSGAMGTIYKAEQTALGKTVVIKVLHRHLLTDPELIQRFHREARAASRLNHPNCVQIMDFGTLDDGSLYIAMEYIQGIDLATLLEREYPIDDRRLINIIKQVCQALDEAHANGVLHRDLKPENIMIEDRRTVRDYVKVVDFGIAKLEDNNPNSRRSFQTRTGIVCGTPEYMSPEQARGLKLDARSDLYAVGVMLYHLMTDHLPFEAPSPIEVVTMHISEPPKPLREWRDTIPESIERLVLTLLEKDREKRPGSALDVHAELERIDRELALQRREKIESKTSDDATMVDMRPISDLVSAIDTGVPFAVATGEVVTESKDDAKQQYKDISAAATADTAAQLSLTDTIPDSVGRELGKRAKAMSGRKSGEVDVEGSRSTERPSIDVEGLVTSAQPTGAPKRPSQSGLMLSRPKPVRGTSQPPNAPGVRELISGLDKPPSLAPAAASPAPAQATTPEPKRRLWLWITLGSLVVAGGAALAVILSTT